MLEEMKNLMPGFTDKFFTTNDGVKLHYLEGGTGEPLILTSGWPTTPCYFAYNLPELGRHYHIYALENRGTGESEKPDHGYRVSRTAMDVYNMMQAAGIEKAIFMGHSMGCATIYEFIDLFGQDKIDRLILVDQPAWLWSNPEDSDEEVAVYGGHRGNPFELMNGFRISAEEGNRRMYGEGFFPTAEASMSNNTATGRNAEKMDNELRVQFPYYFPTLSKLQLDLFVTDMRDIIPHISVPTLFIAGGDSFAITHECIDWYRRTIPNCKMVVFSREEYGNHSMMANNPEKFNYEVLQFLTETSK